MIVLRNLAYTFAFYFGSAVIVTIAVLLVPLGERTAIRTANVWARWAHFCAHHLLGIVTRVEGEPGAGPMLYAVKHESFYETSEMLRLLYDPVTIFKRELLNIPGWGWVARRHGVLAIDREAGAGAVRALLAHAKTIRASGRSVLIFPEGTRLERGARPPLGAGFAGLYKALGMPVVPVALDTGRLWPRGAFLKRRGIVTFRFGPPIPAGLKRDEIESRVHAAINELNDPE